MSDPLEKVAPDEPLRIRARTWNALLDAAKAEQGRKLGRQGGPLEADPLEGSLYVRVRNDTGAAVGEWSVLKPGTPLIDAALYPLRFQAQPVFPGTTPAAATDDFLITVEPIRSGGIGRAVVAGIAVVKMTVSDVNHTCAEPSPGSNTVMRSAAAGPAKVLWKESGTTGSKWAVVLVGRDTAAGGGGSITVKEADNTPTVTGVTTLNLDQADGFQVTNSGGGVVRVDILPATTSQAGIVSTSDQNWNGSKTVPGTGLGFGAIGTIDAGSGSSCYLSAWAAAGVPGGGYYYGLNNNNTVMALLDGGNGRFVVTHAPGFGGGAKYSVFDGTAIRDGATGSLGDGSTVKGGIVTVVGTLTGIQPPLVADVDAAFNSFYTDTGTGRLSYKDFGGTVTRLSP